MVVMDIKGKIHVNYTNWYFSKILFIVAEQAIGHVQVFPYDLSNVLSSVVFIHMFNFQKI